MWNCTVCVGVVFLFPVRMVAKPCHLGVNWPTTHCENKDGVYFFTLNFECYSSYNKLLLCNSENSDIAWWNKNNSKWGFSVIKKRTKILFLFLKPILFKTNPKNSLFFFKKNKRVFLNLGGWSHWRSTCTVYGLPRRDCSFYPCFQSPCHTFHISSRNSGVDVCADIVDRYNCLLTNLTWGLVPVNTQPMFIECFFYNIYWRRRHC